MFKRRYTDLRFGWSVFAPVISFANFIMILYLAVKDTLPVEIIIPFLVIGLVTGLTFLGTYFRRKQLPIDNTMHYEQQTESAKTNRILFDELHKIERHLGIEISQESINRQRYMHDIECGKYGK